MYVCNFCVALNQQLMKIKRTDGDLTLSGKTAYDTTIYCKNQSIWSKRLNAFFMHLQIGCKIMKRMMKGCVFRNWAPALDWKCNPIVLIVEMIKAVYHAAC